MSEYEDFLATKKRHAQYVGFDSDNLTRPGAEYQLFDWQQHVVKIALKAGRFALFEDCGLGKSGQQLIWADEVARHTWQPVFILCPLAVALQTVTEGEKFGVAVTHIREAEELGKTGIYITNYDRLEKFAKEIPRLGGIVLDESSLLKSFTGKTRIMLTEIFHATKFKLCCTATPAPNDYTELGQHAEFLNVMSSSQMLATWFINDTSDTGTWRLKKHARADFWRWVGTWAACIAKPSDIGFSDDGYELPPLELHNCNIEVDEVTGAKEGELFRAASVSAATLQKEARFSIQERCAKAVEIANSEDSPCIIWCELNDESELLKEMLPDAVEIRGADKDFKKERAAMWFVGAELTEAELHSIGREPKLATCGPEELEDCYVLTVTTDSVTSAITPQRYAEPPDTFRALISKPEIFGFGMNMQVCRRQVFVGQSWSMERQYQAIRRSYRFGQTQPVDVYFISPSTLGDVRVRVREKFAQHEIMKKEMKEAAKQITATKDSHEESQEMPVIETPRWKLVNGDCVRVAKEHIKDASVGLSVFSPPFMDLFTYSSRTEDMGNSTSPEEFMKHFGYLVKELTRVTMPGRECVVHCCDLLSSKWKDGSIGIKNFADAIERVFCGDPNAFLQHLSNSLMSACGELFSPKDWTMHSRVTIWKNPVTEMQRTKAHGLLYKTLKKDSSHSRVGMPDYLLVFRRKGDNPKPIAHGESEFHLDDWQEIASPVWMTIEQGNVLNRQGSKEANDERHICPLQLDVIERAVKLWSAPGDLVYSPFTGIGSEGYTAVKMGRNFVGSELKESYFKDAAQWLAQAESEQELNLFALPAQTKEDEFSLEDSDEELFIV